MSQYNLKSTVISNRDATPKVLTDPFVSGGEKRSSQGYVATGSAADAVGSTYRLCQVPSNARVDTVKIQNTALGSGAAVNVGVYYPTFIPVGAGLSASSSGAAISAAYFASAYSVAAAETPTEITNQSGTNTIANQELPLWQAIGLTSDPGIDLDIVITVSTVLAASGTFGMKVDYVE